MVSISEVVRVQLLEWFEFLNGRWKPCFPVAGGLSFVGVSLRFVFSACKELSESLLVLK